MALSLLFNDIHSQRRPPQFSPQCQDRCRTRVVLVNNNQDDKHASHLPACQEERQDVWKATCTECETKGLARKSDKHRAALPHQPVDYRLLSFRGLMRRSTPAWWPSPAQICASNISGRLGPNTENTFPSKAFQKADHHRPTVARGVRDGRSLPGIDPARAFARNLRAKSLNNRDSRDVLEDAHHDFCHMGGSDRDVLLSGWFNPSFVMKAEGLHLQASARRRALQRGGAMASDTGSAEPAWFGQRIALTSI